jgi:hypothetical protein
MLADHGAVQVQQHGIDRSRDKVSSIIALMRSNASSVTCADGVAEHHNSGTTSWPSARNRSIAPVTGKFMPSTSSSMRSPRHSGGHSSRAANTAKVAG